MIRKVIIVLILFLVLIFGGLFVFVRIFDLNKYLPQITQQLSLALGRQATVEKAGLNLSIKQGVVVDLMGISLADDARFSKESFVHIQHIHCGVSPLPFFIKQQIAVTSIKIQSPEIRIIRHADGVSNYESIIEATKPKTASGSSSSSATPAKDANVSFPKVLVSSFEIHKARVTYNDQSTQPATNISLEDIDAKVVNFSLTDSFQIQLDAALFARGQNIHIDGTGRIDPKLQQVRLDDVRLFSNLALLDVERLQKGVGSLTVFGLKPGLSGSVQGVISQMVVGSKGLLVLSLDGKIVAGRIPLKMLVNPIEQLTAKLDVTESKIKISNFSLRLGSGQVSGNAVVKDYLSTQDFEVSISMDRLLLEEVIEQDKSPIKIKGSLSGTMNLSGQGFSPEVLNKVVGQAEFGLTDAELTNVNIIKSILEKIPVLSAVSELAQSQLSEELQKQLGGSSTKIAQAKVKSRIERSNILIDDANVIGEKFSFVLSGNVGFDQSVSLDAELKIFKEMSDSLIASAHDMDALLDENSEIHFPVKITGKIPDLKYMPDVAYISKILIVNKGGGELQKVLDKNPQAKKILDIFIGGKEPTGEGENAATNTDQSGQEDSPEESKGKQFLRGLLKGL